MVTKRIIVFDIDETLLISRENLNSYVNNVDKEKSKTNPYHELVNCYTLHKQRMKEVINKIINNKNYKIAIVTAGFMGKQNIKKFFLEEYNVNLPKDFSFINGCKNKIEALKEIAKENPKVKEQNIILVDNCYEHTCSAINAGYNAIHADTNKISNNILYGHDETDGKVYIQMLENLAEKDQGTIEQDRLRSLAEHAAKDLELHTIMLDDEDDIIKQKKKAVLNLSNQANEFLTSEKKQDEKFFSTMLKEQHHEDLKTLSIQRDRSRVVGSFLLSIFTGGVFALIGLVQYWLTNGRDFLFMMETESEQLLRKCDEQITAYRKTL